MTGEIEFTMCVQIFHTLLHKYMKQACVGKSVAENLVGHLSTKLETIWTKKKGMYEK